MFCYNCGSNIPDESAFCFNCGVKQEIVENEEYGLAESVSEQVVSTNVEGNKSTTSSTKTMELSKKNILIAIVAVLVVFYIGTLFSSNKKYENTEQNKNYLKAEDSNYATDYDEADDNYDDEADETDDYYDDEADDYYDDEADDDSLIGSPIIATMVLVFLVLNLIIYHKLFTVYYFSLGRGLMKEFLTAFIIAILEVGLMIYAWPVASVGILVTGAAIAGKAESDAKKKIILVFFVIVAIIVAILGIVNRSRW